MYSDRPSNLSLRIFNKTPRVFVHKIREVGALQKFSKTGCVVCTFAKRRNELCWIIKGPLEGLEEHSLLWGQGPGIGEIGGQGPGIGGQGPGIGGNGRENFGRVFCLPNVLLRRR